MIKQELRRFASRYDNGVAMYPGVYVLTWLRAPYGWTLVGMVLHEEEGKG